ncbi:MAG: TatD family hydrolase [Acetobacter sp.]|nr:TatD family hydrolase [Acetobacter sp.]
MFTDSHCHIEDEDVLERAFAAGVTTLLNAGKDLDEAAAQLEMCEKYPNVWTSAGVHPDSAPEKLATIGVDEIIQMTVHPKVIAIGECGLDYHYGAAVKEEQKEMFLRHIEAAGQTGLPLMIHQREAEEDMLALLQGGVAKFGKLSGVIHCFTSTLEFAKAVNELGFYISASGIVTFKSGADVVEVFKQYPIDKILIETDSPYLAPVPFRGKTNEPAYVLKTAEKIAEIKGLTIEEIARITTDNFYNLYQKAQRL